MTNTLFNNSNKYFSDRLSMLYVSDYERENKKKNLTDENIIKLRGLKDIHSGNRCFIIGGSPSLKLLDLSKLNNEYTFTINRGYLLKEFGLKNSSYHVMADIKTFQDDRVEQELPKNFTSTFLIYGGIKFPYSNAIYFDQVFKQKKYFKDYFQTDITNPLLACPSSVLIAIQFANYMGFSKIYIIGVDMDFNNQKGHCYKETQGENLRQKLCSHHSTNLALDAFKFASDFLSPKVQIYNASPSGIVNCIPRVKYDTLF